ncbi:hypothetical protein [Alloalcanivorax mobilis]|uniref:hypothetical protein n=1 Tax=Alloalcanivorax mobilis TaxID=2019569 RepID=UPI000C76AE37|nr:hypothetical protein [Alloalcanivorax mobilis]
MKRYTFAGAAVAAILALTGCGGSGGSGGDGGAAAPHSAHFVDNAVTGLHYTCDGGGNTKVTETQGSLTCPAGATVRFLVGDIGLGEAVLNGNTLFITPADLAGEGADQNDNTVINISRFLISLDADQDLGNGIQIDPASHLELGLAIDFAQDPTAFETAVASTLEMLTQDLPGGPFALVPEGDAQNHVALALYLTNAGLYHGTVSYQDNTQTDMIFMVTREGAVYGSNKTAYGKYAATGFDEENDWLSTTGEGSDFKIDGLDGSDGSTGATFLIEASMADGQASGSSDDDAAPRFEAVRSVAFDPVYDQDLVDEFAALLPLAIGIGEDNEARFIIGRNEDNGIDGASFSDFEGGPPSKQSENDMEYSGIAITEVVGTEGRTLHLLGLSMAGYLVDATIDLSGDEPTVNATWQHVHEDRQGETHTFLPLDL